MAEAVTYPCKTCGQYKTPSLATDAGVLRTVAGEQQVLLIERAHNPFKGHWAFPGGFVDYGEAPEVGVLRELEEETNLKGRDPALVAVAGNPKRDPRRHTISILYHVSVDDFSTVKAGDDAANYQFIPVAQIRSGQVHLAFDHGELLDKLLAFANK